MLRESFSAYLEGHIALLLSNSTHSTSIYTGLSGTTLLCLHLATCGQTAVPSKTALEHAMQCLHRSFAVIEGNFICGAMSLSLKVSSCTDRASRRSKTSSKASTFLTGLAGPYSLGAVLYHTFLCSVGRPMCCCDVVIPFPRCCVYLRTYVGFCGVCFFRDFLREWEHP